MVGTSPSPARSDLSVCSAGTQTEASRHQRLFITAETVQRLSGNSVVLTSESLIFFLLLLWRILLYLLLPLPRNICSNDVPCQVRLCSFFAQLVA